MKNLLLVFLLSVTATSANAADKLVVLLDWFINPDHAQLIIADQKGYFTQAGLEVELIEPADPSLPPKLVAANKADIAISYQPQLHVQDVELVNVNFSLSPSLITGQVDAVIGAFRNFELNQMDIEGRPGTAFYPEEEGVPLFDELILVANNDKLDNPALGKFVNALQQATTFIVNHPDEAWELFRDSNRKALDNELNRRAWKDTLPRFALRPAAVDTQRYKAFGDFMLQQGLIESTPAVDSYTAVVN